MRALFDGGGPLDGTERLFGQFREWPIRIVDRGMGICLYPEWAHVCLNNTMPFPETNGQVMSYRREHDDPEGRWRYVWVPPETLHKV